MAGRLFGYARVSTTDQSLEPQLDLLAAAGCESFFQDIASGARSERRGLSKIIDSLQEGDTLIVCRLDRLGRSLPHLIDVVSGLSKRGIHFRSLQDGVIDTTTASGELIFHIFAALAQFERQLIRERTRDGLAAAKARGRTGGRRAISQSHPKVLAAQQMHREGGLSVSEICDALGISRATFYRYIQLGNQPA